MSDDPEANKKPDEPDTGEPSATEDEPDWKAEAERWKREGRKWEERAKANSEASQRLKEIEDSKKTELEKLTEAQKAAEARAAEADARALRLEVAAEKGLTPAQARRLVGKTKEELEADADELLASFRPAERDTDTDLPRRPRERLRSGATPDAQPDETDPRKLAATVSRR